MNPHLRRVRGFALRFLPLLAVCLALYVLALPYYKPLVNAAANAVTERMSPASTIVLEGGPDTWVAYLTPEGGGRRYIWRWHGLHWMYLNLALLPALLLATPTGWVRRLKLVGLALALLPLIHLTVLIALVRSYVCLHHSPGNFPCLWLLRVAYTSGQVVAVVLWGLLTWRHWLPDAAAPGG